MTTDPHQRFCIRPLGAGPAPDDALAVGSLDDMLMHALPQTRAHERRERELAAAEARHAARADSLKLRAEDVIRRENEVEERERADFAAKVKTFADGVAKLQARMDALEQRRADAALAEEIRAADAALKALQADDGPLEVLEPSADRDREELAARGGAPDVDDQLPAGGSPSLPQRAPEILRPPIGAPGGLPASLAKDDADMREFGRLFISGRDRRAARRAARRGN
jgi:hypothetical protein